MKPPCPPLETIRRLGVDSLDPDDFRALESHVADCEECRDRLQRLARLDSTETSGSPVSGPVPAPPPEVPGFVLGAELGRGGSGVVYEAVQIHLGRRVAVKVLTGAPALDARARERWLREARAIARVQHPNIVRLYDAGEHDGRLYLVLDLIPGGSLRDLAPGPIPPRDAARLVETVTRAVGAIHREGMLHLDVKPSNILMNGPPDADLAELSPMLSDFGIAREEAGSTIEAGLSATFGGRGTPAYMAPEQVGGRAGALGPAADVFALGATLYDLLVGRPPFRGASPIETLDLLRTTEPTPPRALAPGVPRDLETIVLKALEKAPARRYASAEALADDLRRWLDGFPIRARPISRAGRLARWCRRRPIPAALAAALAATVLVALVGLTALWRRSEHQRGRAEAALARALDGESTADAAVADLVALLRGAVEAPERSSGERTGDAASAVLALAAKLRRTPDLAARHAVAIARLELHLVGYRLRDGDRDGVRRLLDDGLALLDARPDRPTADAGVDAARVEILLRRSEVALQFARPAEAAEDVRRAERALAPHVGDPRALDAFVALRSTQGALANALAASGDPDAGRRESLADAEMFREWARKSGGPTFRLLAAIARQGAESEPGAERATLTDAVWREFDRLPDAAPIPHGLVVLLADLAARELCESATADVQAGRDAEAIARRVLVESDAQFVRRLPAAFRPEVVERLSQLGCSRAFEDRRDGRLEESRRDASWMIALARALAARDADSVGAHLMLSRALEQEAKNAWNVPDLRAVERSLRAALTEADAAFDLAPDDETCRRHLASLREKFVRLVAAEPDR